jgi:trk system potassium uptake protein TrkH
MSRGLKPLTAVFHSIFHSISAFCNAGFALYSDSFMSFQGNFALNIIIALLIISGGISFLVLTDLFSGIKNFFRGKHLNLSINTRVVIKVSSLLTLISMLIIYKLEHETVLYGAGLVQQYTAAFFQAVTLRTAGFNTIPFENLRHGTLMLMIGVMFIGGASGSTAGGIKVNTLGVVWAYIQTFRKERDQVLLYRHHIPQEQILQAFTVIAFGVLSVFTATFVLLITENAEPIQILFESVSAFATVGLSTGITGSLSLAGKICITILMFFGRIGPLTLLTASSGREKSSRISYPEATLLIG